MACHHSREYGILNPFSDPRRLYKPNINSLTAVYIHLYDKVLSSNPTNQKEKTHLQDFTRALSVLNIQTPKYLHYVNFNKHFIG